MNHTPSHVFVTQKGPVKIITKLYGETTPARVERAVKDAAHRVDQLQPYVEDRAARHLRYTPELPDEDFID